MRRPGFGGVLFRGRLIALLAGFICRISICVRFGTCLGRGHRPLLHATVSENSHFGTADITDFYLGSPVPSPEHMIMYTSLFTPELLLDLGITPFLQTDSKGREFFYAQVDRTLPGFRQAGLHAHQRVVQLLENHGCYQTQPCLFTHVTPSTPPTQATPATHTPATQPCQPLTLATLATPASLAMLTIVAKINIVCVYSSVR